MAEFPAGQERLLKQIVSQYRCQKCRRSFEHDHVRVAARHEQLWIVSVRCRTCRNQQVFWIALRDSEAMSSDEAEEIDHEYLAEGTPVCTDDVLDMHQFLQGFNGDFAELFAGTSSES